jgi:hypothetical protein
VERVCSVDRGYLLGFRGARRLSSVTSILILPSVLALSSEEQGHSGPNHVEV